jgi:hypothetical protein
MRPAPIEYAVKLPILPSAEPPTGWGFFASLQGKSLDLARSEPSWDADPRLRRGEVQAGYGWHGDGTTVVVGYAESGQPPEFAPSMSDIADRFGDRHQGSPGVLGVGLVVHTR